MKVFFFIIKMYILPHKIIIIVTRKQIIKLLIFCFVLALVWWKWHNFPSSNSSRPCAVVLACPLLFCVCLSKNSQRNRKLQITRCMYCSYTLSCNIDRQRPKIIELVLDRVIALMLTGFCSVSGSGKTIDFVWLSLSPVLFWELLILIWTAPGSTSAGCFCIADTEEKITTQNLSFIVFDWLKIRTIHQSDTKTIKG